ncbi:MAG: ribose-phosphate pyrophosphokinase [Clostridiales bacterium]|nr:ribose-phosphate pyrophosphokinase [Clostridiales bacterium]
MAEAQFSSLPIGKLGIIPLPGCEEMAERIDYYLVRSRKERNEEIHETVHYDGYQRDSYVIKADFPRFGTGEGKCVIRETVRGYDIYLLIDPFNYGVKYEMFGDKNHSMSPDDHYANLRRAISAIGGKAKKITVIMPMLYEGRQHRRTARESLDCADMLRELCLNLGVDNIITFDAHDPRVQNAIPQKGFESVQPVYQMIKSLCRNVSDLQIDSEHMMVVSPDEGGMGRCIYFASVLGLELGTFYKRRDYSKVVGGTNPIIEHSFLGDNVSGKDIIIIDDMISSGGSMIEVAQKLKALGAGRIFIFTSFGLFCNGLEAFDKAYECGFIDKVFTTNLVYTNPELLTREWYVSVDMSKYCAYIIDTLNHDESISTLLDPKDRIYKKLAEYGFGPYTQKTEEQ